MSDLILVDLSSIAYPTWHMSQSEPDPNYCSQQIVARVTRVAHGQPHVAICCDSGRSFRKDIAPSYKANRPEREEALMHQIRLAVETLKADGFPVWAVPGFEADDLIATATRLAAERELSVRIVTGDKDLLQLVGDTVTCLSVRDGSVLDAVAVREKFGVTPAQMRDFLTLCGDSSDNVKGAKGIGPKKAAELLKLGTLDAVYDQMTHGVVPGITPALRTALMEFKPNLDETRTLITLRTDAPIPFDEIATERVAAPMQTEEPMTTEETPESAPTPAPEPGPIQVTPAPVSLVPRTPEVLPAPPEWERQLEPRSMREAQALAENMHASRLFLASYGTPQAVLSTILAGRELGLQAMASLRTIHIVEGRPTLSADLIRALVLRSGLAKYFRCIERTHERATFETQRGDDPPIALTYTIAEATIAGLVKEKSGWIKNPADMLVARASAKLARLVYPDLTTGLYTPEEMQEVREGVA